MPIVTINGRKVHIPDQVMTEDNFRRNADINNLRTLLRKTETGLELVPRGSIIPLQDGDEFSDAPQRVKGSLLVKIADFLGFPTPTHLGRDWLPKSKARPRLERVQSEVLLVASAFKDVWYDENCGEWFIIPKYILPPRWSEWQATLLISIPESYPVTPPVGFYLNKLLPLQGGEHDKHFVGFGAHGAKDLRHEQWFWYCSTAEQNGPAGWRASSDYRKPDNLISYLGMVHDSLARA